MNIPDEYKDKTFIAKPNTWFDEGTEVFMVSFAGEGIAVMKGWKSDHEIWGRDGLQKITGWDEETCSLEEFEIIDEASDYELIEEENKRQMGATGEIILRNIKVVQKDNKEEIKNKIIYK